MARELKPCGTSAAARRHLRYGDPPCRVCLDAEAERRRPDGAPPRTPPQHGTASAYSHGCRCAPCTRAHADKHAQWCEAVAGLPAVFVPHGLGGYRNYACRCAVCTAANSEACRIYAEARRERSSQ